MTLTIKKGKHRRTQWWRQLSVWIDKREIAREVMLHGSCVYDLGTVDQADHNKLFGIGYLWDKRESARIGWRWDTDKYKFVLSLYCHVGGRIEFTDLCDIIPFQRAKCFLRVRTGFYEAEVLTEDGSVQLGRDSITHSHKKRMAVQLGLFFGGNNACPHDMKIEIKNLY